MNRPSCTCHGNRILLFSIVYALFRLTAAFSGSFPTWLSNLVLLAVRLTSIALLLGLAIGMGHFIIRKLSLYSPCSLFNFCLSASLGLIILCYGGLASLVKIGGLNLFLPLIIILVYLSFRELAHHLPEIIPKSETRFQDLRAFDYLLISFLLLLLLYALYCALTPPFSWDAQVYHLLIPRIYLQNGGFCYIPLNVYSNMPLNMQVLFTIAMVMGDDVTAKLLHLSIGILLCLSIYAFCRRYFSRRAGLIASLLFLCHPTVFMEYPIAFIDLGVTLFCFWMVISLVRYLETGRMSWVGVMGAFGGMGLGSKYTMFFAVNAAFIILVLSHMIWKSGKRATDDENESSGGVKREHSTWKALGIFAGISFILVLPWLIKNAILTGNPVYPMLYKYFGGRDWSMQQSSWLIDWQHNIGMGRSLADYLLLPIRIFSRSSIRRGYGFFAGTLYPYTLILLPSAFLVKKKRKVIHLFLLFSLFYLVQWGLGAQQVRFLFPILPFLAICGAAGFNHIRSLRPKMIWYGVGALILLMPVHLILGELRPEIARKGSFFPVILGKQTREVFLRPRVRSYPCFEYLSRRCPVDEPVLFLFENKGYYCRQPIYADGMFEASYFLAQALEAGTPEELKERLLRLGCRFVVIDELIREGFHRHRVKRIFSGEENMRRFSKALDIVERFIQRYLTKEFEKNKSSVYRFKGREK